MNRFPFALFFLLSAVGCHRIPVRTESQVLETDWPIIESSGFRSGISDDPIEGLENKYRNIVEIMKIEDIETVFVLNNGTSMPSNLHLRGVQWLIIKQRELLPATEIRRISPKEFENRGFRVSGGFFHAALMLKNHTIVHIIHFSDYTRISYQGKDAFLSRAK
jgi:hypothetical protein